MERFLQSHDCFSNSGDLLTLNLKTSNSQPPSKNDIELKEKRVDVEKDAQSGGNRHKVA